MRYLLPCILVLLVTSCAAPVADSGGLTVATSVPKSAALSGPAVLPTGTLPTTALRENDLFVLTECTQTQDTSNTAAYIWEGGTLGIYGMQVPDALHIDFRYTAENTYLYTIGVDIGANPVFVTMTQTNLALQQDEKGFIETTGSSCFTIKPLDDPDSPYDDRLHAIRLVANGNEMTGVQHWQAFEE